MKSIVGTWRLVGAVSRDPDGRNLPLPYGPQAIGRIVFTADNRVIATVPTGKAPTSISVLPNGRQAYVTDDGDGTIEVLNIAQ